MGMRYKTNIGNMKQEASNFEGGGNADFMKLIDGRNIIRILPPWSEEGRFFQRVGFHRVPGKFSEKVLCPNFTFGANNCPICKKGRAVLEAHGKDIAKPYWAGKRAYLNVLDMKAADGQVKLLEVGPQILNPILNFIAEMDSDELIDPNLGFNVMVTRKKDGNFTKYDTMIMPKVHDLAQHGYNVEEVLNSLNDLSRLVKSPEEDQFFDILDAINQKVFEGDQAAQNSDPGYAQAATPAQPANEIPQGPAGNGNTGNATRPAPVSTGPTTIGDDDIRPAARTAQPVNTPDPVQETQPAQTQNAALNVAQDVSVDDFDPADFTSDDVPF